MALMLWLNLLPPKKKLAHQYCFTPNMLPVTIIHGYCNRGHRCVHHLPFSILSDMCQYVYQMWNKELPLHIDISKVGRFLSEETCKVLQGWHAYTRRYSLSAFSGLVKVSTLKLLMKMGGGGVDCCRPWEDWLGLGSVRGTVYFVARVCVKRMYASHTSL